MNKSFVEDSRAEAQRFFEENPDIELIELLIPDVNGVFRGKRISKQKFLKSFQEGVNLPGSVCLVDITGDNPEGTGLLWSSGDQDNIAKPIAGTLCRAKQPRSSPFVRYIVQFAQRTISEYVKLISGHQHPTTTSR